MKLLLVQDVYYETASFTDFYDTDPYPKSLPRVLTQFYLINYISLTYVEIFSNALFVQKDMFFATLIHQRFGAAPRVHSRSVCVGLRLLLLQLASSAPPPARCSSRALKCHSTASRLQEALLQGNPALLWKPV